jgi:hypothetical protein
MAGMRPIVPPEREEERKRTLSSRSAFGIENSQLLLGAAFALLCFVYAYAIEIQEFICSFGASDRDVPELGLIIVGMGRVGKQLLEELVMLKLTITRHSLYAPDCLMAPVLLPCLLTLLLAARGWCTP